MTRELGHFNKSVQTTQSQSLRLISHKWLTVGALIELTLLLVLSDLKPQAITV